MARPELLEVVRELGVDHAQGYYVGHPAPAAAFAESLRRPRLAVSYEVLDAG